MGLKYLNKIDCCERRKIGRKCENVLAPVPKPVPVPCGRQLDKVKIAFLLSSSMSSLGQHLEFLVGSTKDLSGDDTSVIQEWTKYEQLVCNKSALICLHSDCIKQLLLKVE